jgi:hypothetical protein
MPVYYQIDRATKTIRTRCVGPVTMAEVADHFRALEVDPDCPDFADVLLDLSEATTAPRRQQLRAVTNEIGRIRGRVRFGACAFVACTNELYGMARMFQVFAEDLFRETNAFRSLDEAEVWLIASQGGLPGVVP